MKKYLFIAILVSLASGPLHAEIHILKDKPKDNGWRFSNQQSLDAPPSNSGVISVPLNVDKAPLDDVDQGIASLEIGEDPDEALDFEETSFIEDDDFIDDSDIQAESFNNDNTTSQNKINSTSLTKINKAKKRKALLHEYNFPNVRIKDASTAKDTVKATSIDACSEFSYQAGLLKSNIIRFLDKCGYTIGNWGFGDDEYEYDFEVLKQYKVTSTNMIELLDQIKGTYLVGYKINRLDKTVDFRPSRGDRLNNFELQYR